jgi:hypothetical protein
VRGGRRAAVRLLLRFRLPGPRPARRQVLVAALDQLLEPLQVAVYLLLDDAEEIAGDVLCLPAAWIELLDVFAGLTRFTDDPVSVFLDDQILNFRRVVQG